MKYGYARVSSDTQDYQAQVEALKAAGCERIRARRRAARANGRPELAKLLKALLPGDAVVVTKLDRIARSTRPAQHHRRPQGARLRLRIARRSWCDTSTDTGRLVLAIMGGIAEFERELIRKRCQAGIERAKVKGTKFGRLLHSTQANAARSPSAMPQVRRWPSWRGTMSAARQRSGGRCKGDARPRPPRRDKLKMQSATVRLSGPSPICCITMRGCKDQTDFRSCT